MVYDGISYPSLTEKLVMLSYNTSTISQLPEQCVCTRDRLSPDRNLDGNRKNLSLPTGRFFIALTL